MNSALKQRLFLFCAMACLGMTTEIFFTAINDVIDDKMGLQLKGFSYIWMFPIYGLAGILFPLILKVIGNWNVLLRMCVYATGIIVIEFITGWLLDVFTGACPWEYKTGWQILGYIRIDYFPLWAMFGLMVELALKFLMRLRFE